MSDKKILKDLNEEYPPNPKEPVKKLAPVAKKQLVVARKANKSVVSRMFSSLIDDDVDSVTAYIIQDVLIPAAKTTISDMVSGGIEMLMFGGTKTPRNSRGSGMKSTISYNNPSIRNRESNIDRRNRSSHRFDDVVMDTRADAEIVRENMQNILEEYDQVTVADFYDLAGITSRFTDQNWGWTALPRVQIVRHRRGGGYILNLPKPEEL